MKQTQKKITEILIDYFSVQTNCGLIYTPGCKNKQIPSLYFSLNEDENTETHHQIIKEGVESFEGNLQWRFGKSYPFRINYEIIPKVARDRMDQHYEKNNKYTGYMKLASEEEFRMITELTIEDISNLAHYLDRFFQERML
ncbi:MULTISPECIES: hypothetical protein [Vagococcus]|uniref:Uncharacterized protein n=1 Tax=Vagococcus fluvialis bH819 TaxID=1255619 RepID=A0A1X6WMN5_9ENTE|nr:MULTISPECIES: hypothetical protein [Vagococcus]SLM85529.1 hypothetical protein FM121_05475 [Vagococcus fluvialis bH819]HCM89497.1 hypothetical protein [Vagococcus sp.]